MKPTLDALFEGNHIKRLQKPNFPVDVILDTDTYNEIDDQFALAYLIKSADKLNLKAIYAAPFLNQKSTSAEDGMEKSHEEILRILSLVERNDLKQVVYKGSTTFLPSETVPVQSEAATHLAQLAIEYSIKNPLYVIAIGAITNVASALLINPEIKDRIVVIWLGGHAHDWHDTHEFNMQQDVAAARIIFGCGVPLVQLPCMGVVSAFTISGPELEFWLRNKNPLCNYLVDVTTRDAIADGGLPTWTRAIWDVTAIGWLTGDFTLDRFEHSPIPEYSHRYSFCKTRHMMRYVYHIKRDALVQDLFNKLMA